MFNPQKWWTSVSCRDDWAWSRLANRIRPFWDIAPKKPWNLAANGRRVHLAHVVKYSLTALSSSSPAGISQQHWIQNEFRQEMSWKNNLERKVFICALETQAGWSGWWINKVLIVCGSWRYSWQSTSAALALLGVRSEAMGFRKPRERTKGSGWNGKCQRTLQHRTGVWQHHSDQEGAHRCGSTPKTWVA